MCNDEQVRELKQQITEAKTTEEVMELLVFLQEVCEHTEKLPTDDPDVVQCSCCLKHFKRVGRDER